MSKLQLKFCSTSKGGLWAGGEGEGGNLCFKSLVS